MKHHKKSELSFSNGLSRDKPDIRRANLYSKCGSHSKCAINELKHALESLKATNDNPLILADIMGAEKHMQKSIEVILASGIKSPLSETESEAAQTILAAQKEVQSFSNETSVEVTKWFNTYNPQQPFFKHFDDPNQYAASQKDGVDKSNHNNNVEVNFPELDNVMDWENFDVFLLHEKTNGKSLSTLAVHLFHHFNLFKDLDLDEDKVTRFWVQIEGGYQNVPYHNSIHAADVLRSLAYFLNIHFVKNTFTPLEICASLVAAGIHDHDHPGVNNAHLIRIRHELALRYNDKSVLENHHASTGLQILQVVPQNNFLSHLDKKTTLNFRRLVTMMVLATDMAFHFQLQNDFDQKLAVVGQEKVNLSEPTNRDLLLQQLLHGADLSNCGQPWHLAQKWGKVVVEEFFDQGDKEKALSLPVLPLNDREKSTVASLQHGFIEAICVPMYDVMSRLLPDLKTLLEHSRKNAAKWKTIMDSEQASKSTTKS